MPNSNEKTLKILEHQYQNFITQPDAWDFFLGLAEYVRTLQKTESTKSLIANLEKEYVVAREPLMQLENTAFKELKGSAEKILEIKILKSLAKKHSLLADAVADIKGQLSSKRFYSDPLVGLDTNLFDIAVFLKDHDHAKLVEKYEDENKEMKNIYGSYTFSVAYKKVPNERAEFEKWETTQPWGAWHKLPIVKTTIFEPEKLNAEARAEWKASGIPQLTKSPLIKTLRHFRVQEMDLIRTGKLSEYEATWFKVETYKKYAQRVHTHIMTSLLESEETQESVTIRSDGLITNNSNGFFHKYMKNNKRFKCILRLAEANGAYVDTNVLARVGGYKMPSIFRKEKDVINILLGEKLKLHNFIDDGQKNSGYRINPKYFAKVEWV